MKQAGEKARECGVCRSCASTAQELRLEAELRRRRQAKQLGITPNGRISYWYPSGARMLLTNQSVQQEVVSGPGQVQQDRLAMIRWTSYMPWAASIH
jgi:hypothetical protein